MKTKIIIVVLTLSVGAIYFITNAPHRMTRVQAFYNTMFSDAKELQLDTKNSKVKFTEIDLTKTLLNKYLDKIGQKELYYEKAKINHRDAYVQKIHCMLDMDEYEPKKSYAEVESICNDYVQGLHDKNVVNIENDKNLQFKELFICKVDGKQLTIINSSENKLTEEEAHNTFLRMCEQRDINPNQCSKKHEKIRTIYEGTVVSMTKNTITIKNKHDDTLTEYKFLGQINPLVKIGVTIKEGQTIGRS